MLKWVGFVYTNIDFNASWNVFKIWLSEYGGGAGWAGRNAPQGMSHLSEIEQIAVFTVSPCV